MTKKELAEKIYKFLETYAATCPDCSDEYTSPDAYQLENCATLLTSDKKLISMPWSEWGSGGYKPYSSKQGKKEHDNILSEIKKIIE